ncbi:hypothetical protein DICPUDRAFT_151587 [Dictyostelium purpureum]|uniref:Uncharacterized protein n=1 Tax=Dictyostelium purpureum TaxID=5786 RepID=F0ZJ81_DICPU|nr:uncharacterized protein DICPUDRAFT_151587 [Dictyostelium purpureum]EGC35989.1 hypothetical protein DICPUDRAFT_151587 [Dictyostelium purpureum]|eukprot:XP_003287490.1 hypothetical protein DICPUDRAFT_151587 [Dictyostelium purpureum]
MDKNSNIDFNTRGNANNNTYSDDNKDKKSPLYKENELFLNFQLQQILFNKLQFLYYDQLKHRSHQLILQKINEEFIDFYKTLLDLFRYLENHMQKHPLSKKNPVDNEYNQILIKVQNECNSIQNYLNKLYQEQKTIIEKIISIDLNNMELL